MDNTEAIRKIETGQPAADLAELLRPTWDTAALQQEYEVLGFAAPFVVVRRRSDNVKGSLEFQASPGSTSTSWRTEHGRLCERPL